MSSKDGSAVKGERTKLCLEISKNKGTAVVRCRGRICFREEALSFSRIVIELLLDGRAVVLEFSGVEALDSAGIGELVLVHMQAQAVRNAICLVAPSPHVRKLLELTNVASLFAIHTSVETALTSLASQAA